MATKTSKKYPGRLSHISFFTRMEMAELPKLLMPGEKVLGVISGFANGGTVLLAVTSERMLLIDKKWMRMSYEDVRYESINEVTYSHQGFLAAAKFYVMGRDIMFKSWYRKELRMLVQFAQNKMFELRPATKADTKKYGFKKNFTIQELNPTPVMTGGEEQPTEESTAHQMLEEARKEVKEVTEIPRHITDRVARWQRAAKFVGGLSDN